MKLASVIGFATFMNQVCKEGVLVSPFLLCFVIQEAVAYVGCWT